MGFIEDESIIYFSEYQFYNNNFFEKQIEEREIE